LYSPEVFVRRSPERANRIFRDFHDVFAAFFVQKHASKSSLGGREDA
jgi:hypothetical protein